MNPVCTCVSTLAISSMRCSHPWLVLAILFSGLLTFARAQEVCPRGSVGGTVPEPADIRSKEGILRVDLSYRRLTDAGGLVRYCYLDKEGSQSPTLRVRPGDQVTLTLHNELPPGGVPTQRVTTIPQAAAEDPWMPARPTSIFTGSQSLPCAIRTMRFRHSLLRQPAK